MLGRPSAAGESLEPRLSRRLPNDFSGVIFRCFLGRGARFGFKEVEAVDGVGGVVPLPVGAASGAGGVGSAGGGGGGGAPLS